MLLPLAAFIVAFFFLAPGACGRQAYVTFVADDEYAVGARTLGASLRASGSKKEMVAILLNEVTSGVRGKMREEGWRLVEVPLLHNPFHDEDHYTFTKLGLWALLEYERAVFLDADCVVRTNIDEVFQCGQVLCASMGRHHSRKFDFDLGLLVLHPSVEAFQQLVDSASHIAKFGRGAEFNFLNAYFLHWCRHGTPPLAAPSNAYGTPYEPPMWDPLTARRSKDWCYQLDETYNWQWGSDANDTLLGTENFASDFHPDVRVVHFAGKNVKPWYWKNYPLHGWIVLWHSFASQVSGLVPVSSYILYVVVPLVVALVAYAVSVTSAADKLLSESSLIASADRSLLPLACWKPVLAKHLSIWALGGIPVVVIPAVLYRWDLILPPILSPLIGWSLFFAWASLLYWAVYGPYVFYHYQLGRAFASPSVISSPRGQHEVKEQLRWLRSTPTYIPKQTSVFVACLLHSVGFAILGYLLVALLASVLAWSSPFHHLAFTCLYSVIFLVHFAYWGAGLPRHAFLTGFRSRCSPSAYSAIGISLSQTGVTNKRD